uniref:Uncharacterized protein n=1 Tax=Hyaloperonospora arabidopsidis (strain Emoy2) TaxID=559515 RepID=M4B5I5_HYAAE
MFSRDALCKQLDSRIKSWESFLSPHLFIKGYIQSPLTSCSVACRFTRIYYNYPNLCPIVYQSPTAPQNIYVFTEISFYVYSSFSSIPSIFSCAKPRLRSLFLSPLYFVSLVLAVILAVTQISFCGVEEQVRALCPAQRHIQQCRATRIGSTASSTCSNSKNNRCVNLKDSWFVNPNGQLHAWILSDSFNIVAFP